MRTDTLALITALVLWLPQAATAEDYRWEEPIDGTQSGTGESGTGTVIATLDDDTNLLSWDISWSGLTGAATLMHFHGPSAPGGSAGVRVNVGTISGLTSPSIGSTTISEAFATELKSQLWYLNIHTAAHPGGEIRGHLFAGALSLPSLRGVALVAFAGLLALTAVVVLWRRGAAPA